MFLIKIAIFLSLSLHEESPSFKRSYSPQVNTEHPASSQFFFSGLRIRIRVRMILGSRIRIRIRVNSWIRIRIKVNIRRFFRDSKWNRGRP